MARHEDRRGFRPLPEDLTRRPVSISTAAEIGVSRKQLRGALWQPNTRGFYLWAGVDADNVDVRIAQATALLPTGAAIGGWASLYLQGAIDLDGGSDLNVQRTAMLRRSRTTPAFRPSTSRPAPVLVCVGPGARIRPRDDVDLSRRALPDEDVVMVGDVPCVRAARAATELMGRQPPEDGLVSVDAVLRAGLTELDEISAYVAANPRVVGAERIRRLLRMADGNSRSCPESRLRWIWCVQAGLPRPLVNVTLLDQYGRELGIPDLLDEESGLVGEYDGAQHRELGAHTLDNDREERFERHNLLVARATSIDIFRRRQLLIARLRAAHRDGLRRDRSRDRWTIAV